MLDPTGRGRPICQGRGHQRRLRRSELRAGPGERVTLRPVDAGGSELPAARPRRRRGVPYPVSRASDAGGIPSGHRIERAETMANGRSFFRQKTAGAGAPPSLHPGARRRICLPRRPRHRSRRSTPTTTRPRNCRASSRPASKTAKRLRARGSLWSLSTAAVTDGRLIDTTTLRVALRDTGRPDRSPPTPATSLSCASSSAANHGVAR